MADLPKQTWKGPKIEKELKALVKDYKVKKLIITSDSWEYRRNFFGFVLYRWVGFDIVYDGKNKDGKKATMYKSGFIAKQMRVGESDYYEFLFRKSLEYIVPEVGFKIRLVPGVLPDKSGNTPHVNNPWRRIEGEQPRGQPPEGPLETERPKVVTVKPGMFNEDNPWVGGESDVAPIRVDEDLTIKEVIEQQGLPGVLVKFQYVVRPLLYSVILTLMGKDSVRYLSAPGLCCRDKVLRNVGVGFSPVFFFYKCFYGG